MQVTAYFLVLFLLAGTPSGPQRDRVVPEMVTAKTVALVIPEDVNPEIVSHVHDELKKWGRFEIVDDVTRADLAIVLTAELRSPLWWDWFYRATLRVYKGGGAPDLKAEPLWGVYRVASYFDPAPGVIAVRKLRKEIERMEREAKKAVARKQLGC